jgi:hypothetical protein
LVFGHHLDKLVLAEDNIIEFGFIRIFEYNQIANGGTLCTWVPKRYFSLEGGTASRWRLPLAIPS